MRRFTELLGFDVLGGFASFADAGFLGIFYDAALGQRGRRLFSMLRLGGS
jgi:hypothetical protein